MQTETSRLAAVITTIQSPTPATHALSKLLKSLSARMVVVGDSKGPDVYELTAVHFLNLRQQLETPFEFARIGPTGHYTRKNVGYLEAIRLGATCIYETDDDNAPLASWTMRTEKISARRVESSGWVNAYRCFTSERIWPRGLPLDEVVPPLACAVPLSGSEEQVRAPIQQGLANGSPDVDAVWRLVLDRPFDFDNGPSVLLPPGAWCPFNSQSTWWWPDAFPLLYLPSLCTFRMTDIWRSFVAQRCLWALGHGVVFHAPEVIQDRNEHDLMRDFADEVPGYLHNRRIAEILESLTLPTGSDQVGQNLMRCYEALVAAQILPEKELVLVAAWLSDLSTV